MKTDKEIDTNFGNIYDMSVSSIELKDKVSLDDVKQKFKEYLYLKDTLMLETILAVVLSNGMDGTPLWVIFCGASGDTKTSQLKSIINLDNVISVDQLTKNTLVSGKPKTPDLGFELQNNSHILLLLDLASLSSKHPDEKKEIFAQMRNLYDGYLFKMTGAGVKKEYKNCHVSMISGATPQLKREYLIHQQLGSRELIFDTGAETIDNNNKMSKAWDNEEYEKEMDSELRKIVEAYLSGLKIKSINISKENKEFLMKQANKLAILRAVGSFNRLSDELDAPIHPEVPTRLIKQFKRLWICLKSLSEDYPDERIRTIIKHIVSSSGNENRQMILKILNGGRKRTFSVNNIRYTTKLGYRACKRELELLWNVDLVEKSKTTIVEDEGIKKGVELISYQLNGKLYDELFGVEDLT